MATAFNLTPDRVAVFNSDFVQVFQFARPVNARVSERSQMLDHPIETGQLITDYSIVLPIEIEISFIVESDFYQSMYQQIRTLFKNKQLLTVQTSTANYGNMVIADMPHEERADLYDALPISLRFRQIQIVPDPSTFVPANQAQADTQSLGQQNGTQITGVQTTIGTQTSPSTAYSSVPNATTGLTPTAPTPVNSTPITGAQTLTSQQSLSTAFGGSGVPIGSNR